MSKHPAQAVPAALPIRAALARSSPLAQLRARLDDSRQRYEAVATLIPQALREHLLPGPVDETGWTLLAANVSVAAKLRQLHPRLEAALRERGWTINSIRIKVQPPP